MVLKLIYLDIQETPALAQVKVARPDGLDPRNHDVYGDKGKLIASSYKSLRIVFLKKLLEVVRIYCRE